tara:strand:+ start:213 stop:596 length:384 start_codon:yes stop_codon:yes gene_type:complete
MAVAELTNDQLRMLRDYIPALSQGHPPSFDIAGKLDEIIALENANESALARIVSGTASIDTAATSVVVALPVLLDGSPAVATLADSSTTTEYVQACEWDGAGNLTITVDTAPGGGVDCRVYYSVDAR